MNRFNVFAVAVSVMGLLVAIVTGPWPAILVGAAFGFLSGAAVGYEYRKTNERHSGEPRG